MKMKADKLKLADVVELGFSPFGSAVVKQIRDDKVTLFRPYALTQDFSYTGGVICSVGIEEIVFELTSDREFEVVTRTNLR